MLKTFIQVFLVTHFLLFATGCNAKRTTLAGPVAPGTITASLEARVSGSGNYSSSSLSISSGQAVDLKWTITGTPTTCVLRNVTSTPVNLVADAKASSQYTTSALTAAMSVEVRCSKGSELVTSTVAISLSGQALTTFLEARLSQTGNYAALPLSIASGQAADLRWTVSGNPTSCVIKNITPNPAVTLVADAKAVNQFTIAALTASSNLELRCVRGSESIASTLLISVSGPLSVTLEGRVSQVGSYVGSPVTLNQGQAADLRWTIGGDPTSCTLATTAASPVTLLADAKSVTQFTTAAINANTTVQVRCVRGSDSVQANFVIQLSAAFAVSLEGTLSGSSSWGATAAIFSGESVAMRWIITGNPSSCTLRNSSTQADIVQNPQSSTQTTVGPLTATATYGLVCVAGAETRTASFVVTVSAVPYAQLTLFGASTQDFGDVEIGQFKSMQFRVKNTGSIPISNIGRIPNDGLFRYSGNIAQGSGTSCSAGVLPNANCDFVIVYYPAANAVESAEIALSFDYTHPTLGPRSGSQVVFSATGKGLIQQGVLDPTFGNAGVFTHPSLREPSAVLIAADGSILITAVDSQSVGGKGKVHRITSAGVFDTAFGKSGSVPAGMTGFTPQQMAFQLDGKIIVSGYITGGAGFKMLVWRLNSDGSFDTSFGTGGSLISNVPLNIRKLLIQPDGKILGVGEAVLAANALGNTAGMLVRLNSNGTFDSSFGINGVSYLNPTFIGGNMTLSMARAVILDAGGNIYVQSAGDFQSQGYGIVLSKLQPNGYVVSGGDPFLRLADVNSSYRDANIYFAQNQIKIATSFYNSDPGLSGFLNVSTAGTFVGSKKFNGNMVGSAMRADGTYVFYGRNWDNPNGNATLLDSNLNPLKVYPYAIPGGSLVAGAVYPVDNRVVLYSWTGAAWGQSGVTVVRFLP